jgi:hypothetical protein
MRWPDPRLFSGVDGELRMPYAIFSASWALMAFLAVLVLA